MKASWEIRKTLFSFLFSPLDFKTKFRQAENLNKFAKQFNGAKFVIKAGFMDGKILPLDEINAMAELPSKEVLQAQVLGTMLAPITSLAIVLKAIAEEKGGFVEAAAEPEAAPAE